MLNRNMQVLYNADDTATSTPPPDTQQDDQKGTTGEPKLHTAEEVSRIASNEAKKARAKAESAMLERLGVANLDEVLAILDAKRKQDENEKTEAQKLADELAKLKADLETERNSKKALEAARIADKRDGELRALLNKAHDPNQVLILLKAQYGAKLDELMGESGEFNKDNAAALIAEYQKGNAFLFKDTSMGSAMSNRDGRAPEPNKDAQKQITDMVTKTIKGAF